LTLGYSASSKQDHLQATYNCKRLPSDNLLHFNMNSKSLLDLIRGSTHPYPGAYCYIQESGVRVTIWKASRVLNAKKYFGSIPGRIVEIQDTGVKVLTGDGEILIELAQTDSFPVPVPANLILSKLSMTLSHCLSTEFLLTKIQSLELTIQALESKFQQKSE
jgi:methionyl-tRNA formyltransferase